MWYLLLKTSALFLAIRYLPLLLRSEKNPRNVYLPAEEDDELSEIEATTWPQLSVFEHIERGLRMNPHGPAVICLMEHSASIKKLGSTYAEDSEVTEGSEIRNKSATRNLRCKDQTLTHSPLVLADTPPHGATHEDEANAFTLTYTQLHRISLKLATGLLAIGVQPNTRMIMLIPNGAEYAILLWTCILLHITYVNLDPAFLEISGFTSLKHTLQTIKPQLVVVPDARSGKAIDVAISELGLPQPAKVCLFDSAPTSTKWKSLVVVATNKNSQHFADNASLLSAARQHDMNHINSIMFTSGTSGVPKGCPQTVAAISHALHSQEWLIDRDSGAAKYALMQPHNSRGIAPAQTLQTWRAGGAVVLTGQKFRSVQQFSCFAAHKKSFLLTFWYDMQRTRCDQSHRSTWRELPGANTTNGTRIRHQTCSNTSRPVLCEENSGWRRCSKQRSPGQVCSIISTGASLRQSGNDRGTRCIYLAIS